MNGRRPETQHARLTTGKPDSTLTSEPPDYLTGHAARVWRETITDLEAEGRPIHRLNRQTLVGFCDAAAIVRECGETLAREGHLVDGGREGLKRNPAATLRISALQALRAFAAELGLTPASNARLPQPHVPEKKSKFADL